MVEDVIYGGKDYTGLVEFFRTEDTPEEIAEILEEMVYTFAIERLETQLIGKDDAYLVGFMRSLIRAVRSIKPAGK